MMRIIIEAGSEAGWMETYTGRKFYPLAPKAEDVCIEDIAHSLAYQCRYGGHAQQFYSVAEHSCLLTDYALRLGWDHGLIALLHDAAEAYLCDMIRPVKHRMPEYQAAEAKLEGVLFPVFGLPYPLPGWMKMLDNRILVDERAQVTARSPFRWAIDDLAPLGVRLRFWPPAVAEQEFLIRFSDLTRVF